MTAPEIRHIAIDGPIGIGKTTLAKRLSEELKGSLLLETEAANPFLAGFYKDRRKNAFKTQLFFLLSRYQQLKEWNFDQLPRPLVCDYTFDKDTIFAKVNLNETERELYHQVYNLLDKNLPKPDIVVYLRAGTDVLLERIRTRGVEFEKPITKKYLDELMNAYNDYFLKYQDTPLLVVDATHTNFLTTNDQYNLLKKEILHHRQGTKNLVLR